MDFEGCFEWPAVSCNFLIFLCSNQTVGFIKKWRFEQKSEAIKELSFCQKVNTQTNIIAKIFIFLFFFFFNFLQLHRQSNHVDLLLYQILLYRNVFRTKFALHHLGQFHINSNCVTILNLSVLSDIWKINSI